MNSRFCLFTAMTLVFSFSSVPDLSLAEAKCEDALLNVEKKLDIIGRKLDYLYVKANGSLTSDKGRPLGERCPDGYLDVPKFTSCYKFVTDKADWFAALDNCTKGGATLASLETPDEDNFIRLYVMSQDRLRTTPLYISGNDLAREGDYRWYPSGEILAYIPYWASGNPQGKGENCICLKEDQTYRRMYWFDTNCDNKFGWICELKY